jgi:hypothetical protein
LNIIGYGVDEVNLRYSGHGFLFEFKENNCVFGDWGRGSCWGIRFMNCVFGEWGEGGGVGELG